MKSSTKTDANKANAGVKSGAPGGDLDAYRRKRDPSRTNEPFASERTVSPPSQMHGAFVVHLHAARRRHYDLRLQVGGTLQSFAVPRGPSLDPREKRLAVHTEDHPLEYLDFEDVIPEGNYGAGAMIAWDLGRVQFLEPPVEGLHTGKLDFVLHGYKLLGRYALVHTGDRKGRAPEEKNQWLLIKKQDAHSSPDRDIIAELPESVLSGLTVEQLASRADITRSLEAFAVELGGKVGDLDARRTVPMLCGTDGERLDDPTRYYELKLDGVRLLADRRGEDVALVYRSQRIMTATYPEVARAVRALPLPRVVLDGEVVAFDDAGRPSFQRLGRRMHLTRPHDVQHAAAEVPVVYVVFDVLQVGDRDVCSLPLSARKALLARIAPRRGPIRWLDHLEGNGRPLYELCGQLGLEGLVSKRASSPYRPGPDRTDDWLKIKRDREADFVVSGWVEGKGTRKTLGAVEVASYVDGKCVLRGRVGSGLEERTIRLLRERLAPLEVDRPTADGEPIGAGVRHFVKPELVVNVSFGGFTEEGHLRHPVFCGIRDDIAPSACTAAPAEIDDIVDAPAPPPEPAPAEEKKLAPPAPSRRVRISNRDKVFWPDEGYTKGELIDYYLAISQVMLPFLRDRPIVLVRYPDGIKGKSFYQWNVPEGTPAWVHTLHLPPDEDGHQKHTFLVSDADGLAHVINLGCIPVHVLPYRQGSMSEMDYFVVDFDLGPRPLSDAVTLALSLREILTEIGLVGFPKTSGQSGLHVLVPLGPGVPHDVGKTMVELVCRLLQIRHPELSTMERRVAGRGDRVFIDTGQTGRSRTIVAPYSVRAHPGATVSLPLQWEDVHRALDPREFSMFAVPDRVAERGDALEGFFDVRPDVPSVVERLGKKLGAG
ncbi:MAG TPA: DNA ligase D [Polyangiaceae bacterium]|nr:DNA ligase D [Polyangiaceae bacterium]